MNQKTVVFIGGSAFSGSTFLDMMIASGDKGFSIGEANAYYYPYKKKHLQPICGCGDSDCSVWNGLKNIKPSHLYKEIFKRFPDSQFIVDSSKDPLWIKQQSKSAKSQGITVKHVLIWKRAQGFALSQFKRGHYHRWQRPWINYYRLYFALFDEFISINYETLVQRPKQILKTICERIGLDYFDGKEDYWDFKHHTLYGNNSAKVHLFNEKSDSFSRVENELKDLNPSYLTEQHKKIYYDTSQKKRLPEEIHNQIRTDKAIISIEQLLDMTDQQSLYDKEDIHRIDQLRKEMRFGTEAILLREVLRMVNRVKNYIFIQKLGAA